MVNYNISLNKELAEIVEYQVKRGKYANKSEFFRDILRKKFVIGENLEEDEVSLREILPGTKEHKDLMKLREEGGELIPLSEVNEEIEKALTK